MKKYKRRTFLEKEHNIKEIVIKNVNILLQIS